MIEIHKSTKKIYGRSHDGLTYKYLDMKSWVPCLHIPVEGMVKLDRTAYALLYQSFAERVADVGSMCLVVRLECGLDQEQFAGITGMTQQAISRLECGTREETKIHNKLFKCIEVINDAGLLEKLG